jgi:hypothetical protein
MPTFHSFGFAEISMPASIVTIVGSRLIAAQLAEGIVETHGRAAAARAWVIDRKILPVAVQAAPTMFSSQMLADT